MRIRALLLLAATVAAGCHAADDKSDMQQRQDSALKDPFNYGPSTPAPGGKPSPDAGTGPKDQSLKSDWDRFWNP